MPVWRPTPVDAAPQLDMRSWMLIRTECGDVHLVGYNVTESEGRVSSPLVAFDVETRTAVTRSGRRYVLIGEPGSNADASYTFAVWCEISQVAHWANVTEEVLARGLPVPVDGAVGAADSLEG